jgi:F420-dependent oxidoreductase-like protein
MNGHRPRFSIQTGQLFAAWEELVRIWSEAERLGYDSAYGYDHFMAVMMDPFDPCLEAWTTLAALAVHTRRIRLGILVTGNTYRHPAVLAKMATTVDVISGGRLDFGIGSGWFEPEHLALGLRFGTAAERCDRLDEALTVIRALWSEREATCAGRYYRLERAVAEPKPVQRPHPPILIAASGEKKMLRIVARHADAWNSFGSPAVLARKTAVLAAHCRACERDVEAIEKSVLLPAQMGDDPDAWAPLVQGFAAYNRIPVEEAPSWMLLGSAADVRRQIDAYLAVGVTHFILTLTPYNFEVMERFAAEVMPAYRS